MGQLLTNQRPGSGVWAPLVSRATDHHHQKPLISLTAGKIVKLNVHFQTSSVGFSVVSPPILSVIARGCERHMASKYCGYLASDTCRPQPARVSGYQ